MGILNSLKKIDRRHWFICHNCLMHQNHDPLKALFYTEGPGEDFMGRIIHHCPRCSSSNTRSFQQLKDEGSDQQLVGLERIVRKHPRRMFEVPPAQTSKKS